MPATAGSRKYQLMGRARTMKSVARAPARTSAVLARAASCVCASVRFWTRMASRPKSPIKRARPIGTVAMATTPKSAGLRTRAT